MSMGMGGMGGGMMGGRGAFRAIHADQSVKTATVARGTTRRILAFAWPQRVVIVLFLVVTVLDAATVVVQPLLIQRLIDHGILTHDGRAVTWLALAMLATAIFTAALSFLGQYLSSLLGEGMIYRLRATIFAHVQRQSLAFFTRAQTGALISRLNNDVTGAQRAFTSTISSGIGNVITVAVVGVTMLALSWQITLLGLCTFPFLWLVSRWVSRHLADLTRQQMDGNADMSTMMSERFNVGGAILMKLFGRSAEENAQFAAKAGVVRDLGVRITLVGRLFGTAMMLVPAVATTIVYGVGGHMVLSESLTLGTLTALATLLVRLLVPLQGLSAIRLDVMTALVSFERVFELLDLPSLIQEKPGAQPLPRDAASVRFDHVAFAYPTADQVSLASLEAVARHESVTDPEPVLRDIDFVAEAGHMVAIVGPSGAGKTTITHLVARLYDVTAGAVLIGGVDVRDTTLESLTQQIGYVTQDAHMFHDTIRGNLVYAKPEATDEQLWAALEAGQIADLVRRLSDGLDTVVGDRGYRLSGGERQRLAIARLLLKAPAIVVLDEATAHLDSESEVAVQKALDTALEGRTSLVIAHRLSTVRDADTILVVDEGRVVQSGTHEELLTQGGLYADLYETQFRVQHDATP